MPRLLPVLLAASLAYAGPRKEEEAADRVIEALRAKDVETVRVHARAAKSNAWIVADVLLGRGESAAALEYAKLAEGRDVARLGAYVSAYRAPPDDAERRAALASALDALDAKRFDGVLTALSHREATDVPSIRALAARADALVGLRRNAEAVPLALAAADAARDLGWTVEAIRCYQRATNAAQVGPGSADEVRAGETLLGIAEERKEAGLAARTRSQLGDAYRRIGEPAKAREALERAAKELEAVGDRANLAPTVANLSKVLLAAGDFDGAIKASEQALALFEETKNGFGVVAVLENLGNIYNAKGEFDKARERHEAALVRAREIGHRRIEAQILGNLANDASKLGELAKALDYVEQAIALVEQLGDRGLLAHQLGMLASIHTDLGNIPKAIEVQRRSLAMAEESGELQNVAEQLSSLGSLEHRRGNLDAAEEHFRRELQIVERLGNRPATATVLTNLGTVAFTRGMGEEDPAARAKLLGEAEDLLRRAVSIQKELGLSVSFVHTSTNLGAFLFNTGQPDKAIPALEAAVEEGERLLLGSELAYALERLACAHQMTGNFKEAIAAARRGATVAERTVLGLGDEQGAFARQVHRGIYEAGLLSAVGLDDVREGSRWLEFGRAGALREALAAREAMRASAIPAELLAAEDAARARETEAIAAYRAAVAGGKRAAIRSAREAADAATAEVEAVIERMQRTAKRGTSLAIHTVVDVDELKADLAPNEAFITYTFIGNDPGQVLALVVHREGAHFVGLGKVEAVIRNCEKLRCNDPTEPMEAIEDALNHIGGHLVRRYELPEGITRIYVSPDGITGYVPFTLLFPGREIVYEPSFTTYDLLLKDAEARGSQILALGDPDYGGSQGGAAVPASVERGGRDERGARLAPLPSTRGEATAIGDIVLLGKDASEERLLLAIAKHGGRFRAIHFACHGLVDPDHPARCALALTPSGGDDGFLTARELVRTRVPADLAVLSACETAKGKVLRGEGILGLTRAFMCAGTPRVLCSLWKVDDAATQALMTKFYEAWKSGTPAATALKQAQDFVRSQEKWQHPYYWAAWVLWGDPR